MSNTQPKPISHKLDTKALELFNNRPKPKFSEHRWVQRGPILICTSCVNTHSIHIGVDKKYCGLDEKGNPIFEMIDKSSLRK